MSLAAAARIFAALAVLPLGNGSVRILVASVFAISIGTLVPSTAVSPLILSGELALGAAMGVLAGLPIYAARALHSTGVQSAGLLGQTWLWALFFGAGGAGLWLMGLSESLEAIPAGAWPDEAQLAAAGSAFFYCALLLALPVFLVDLAATPLAGWLDRVGRPGQGDGSLTALRPLLIVLALVVTLPMLLEMVRHSWWAALSNG